MELLEDVPIRLRKFLDSLGDGVYSIRFKRRPIVLFLEIWAYHVYAFLGRVIFVELGLEGTRNTADNWVWEGGSLFEA